MKAYLGLILILKNTRIRLRKVLVLLRLQMMMFWLENTQANVIVYLFKQTFIYCFYLII